LASETSSLESRPVTNPALAAALRSSAAPPHKTSVFDSLFSKSNMERVDLNYPFPETKSILSPLPTPSSETQITTLPSGLRVASIESTSPIVHLGVFIDAGSRYEAPEYSGITSLLECLAFKSTRNRSDFRLTRELAKLGANVACQASREHVIFSGDALREYTPQLLGTFADVLQYPMFDKAEIEEVFDNYEHQAKEREKKAETIILEMIHEAAYGGQTLGNAYYADTANFRQLGDPSLLSSWNRLFYNHAPRIVISAVGPRHDELVELVNKLFINLHTGETPPKEDAKYIGSEVRSHKRRSGAIPHDHDHPLGLTHFALGFESAGSWHNEKDLYPLSVLQTIMGGGGSFSAGGPGKGMYSRLYEKVLNQFGWIESAHSHPQIYTDSALLVLYGVSEPEHAGGLAEVLVQEALAMSGPVTDIELKRAKNMLKANIWMQSELRIAKLEDIGRQIVVYGKVTPPEEICRRIDAVTASDVRRVASQLLKTKPSVAAYGDLHNLPNYSEISKALGYRA
jgi:processing peptidase subunit alpha